MWIGISGVLAVLLVAFGGLQVALDPEAMPFLLALGVLFGLLAVALAIVLWRKRSGAWERDSVVGEIWLRNVATEESRDGTLSYRIDAELALPGRAAAHGRYLAQIPPYLAAQAQPGARFACRTLPENLTRVLVQFEPARPDRWVEFMPPWAGDRVVRSG
ncbi:hypothetical protein Val02_68610 [Virgisporangium aliadipatigenens]|uniref:Uncharacterized protein n=1 Tax=Virgisporangium aliadipatigenens TaxID=741659 RepID=A0A8J4DT75_9ACTN|nr:hypothetical protein Val02_68610 [Virgisporangium aliadipatigenens]